jgi:membrane protein DedA with SNARE-associated domain
VPGLDLIDILRAPYDGYNWLADVLFLALNGLFDRFGTPIVFFAALAETTVGVGVVFPGVVLMFLGGANAGKSVSDFFLVYLMAVTGTALGDTISYALGRWGGTWMLSTRMGPSLRLGAEVMRGRARWLIPFYHLHSMTRAVGPFGAGALHIPLRVWMPLDYIGAIIANGIWVGSGFILGRAVLTEEGTLDESPVVRIGLIVVGLGWFLVMRQVFSGRVRAIREREEAAAAAAAAEAETTADPPAAR